MDTLIAADDIFTLSAVLFGLAWLGFMIDGTWLGRKTSGMLWVLLGGVALSNFRVTPFESPVYGFVGEYVVSLAIPLLLFKADLRKILRESGRVMIAFVIGACGTIAGAVIGYWLLDLGEIGPKVAGVYTGGWTGGAVNVVAVAKAVEMTPEQFTVALSASNIVSVLALMTLIALPAMTLVRRFVPSKTIDAIPADELVVTMTAETKSMHLTHVSGALALSFAICAAANLLANAFAMQQYSILLITVLVLVVANLFPQTMDKLEGDFDLGMLAMFIFFAAIGCGTDATAFIESAVVLFIFGMTILVVHVTVVLLVARLLKIDLAEAIVGSAANFVGPAPTAAIAMARGWKSLVTPGIMCGIFGYMIGTFIGVTLTAILD
ncbi:MAG: DUF819 family protein [Gammaproteobacteria bacterium]|nr:DUF819 family protein [Gammaproteobacteria bacterium]